MYVLDLFENVYFYSLGLLFRMNQGQKYSVIDFPVNCMHLI